MCNERPVRRLIRAQVESGAFESALALNPALASRLEINTPWYLYKIEK